MGLLSSIKSLVSGSKTIVDFMDGGWRPYNGGGLVGDNEYENAYDNIGKIASYTAIIEPYLIDLKGERVVKENAILKALYAPNRQMSALKFRKALSLMSMVHDEFYVRVHHRGDKVQGKINPETITGFTFLERVSPRRLPNGTLEFNLGGGNTITDAEVMVFMDVNPYDLLSGFSPVKAARRWTRIDDYIADYQAGFFKNGAIPAGEFIITAKDVNDFKDLKKMMEKRHRGAGKNNNVIYTYRPAATKEGKALNAQIEWVPFNTANKDLALKDLLDSVTKKVDSTFGVPAEIRGFLQNSNYASVSVAERVFIDYTIRPHALAIWDCFTHELIRITGGFDSALAFDLETPTVAEEELRKAEKQKVEIESLKILTDDMGYTHESAVAALGLPDAFKNLKKPTKATEAANGNSNPDAEDLNKNTPNQSEIVKRVSENSKLLSDSDREQYQRQIEMIAKNRMNEQVNRVIVALDEGSKAISDAEDESDATNEEDEHLAEELLAALLALITLYGPSAQARGVAMLIEAGLPTNAITQFSMLDSDVNAYKRYLLKVAKSFNAETSQKIRNVLTSGIENKLSTAEMRQQLQSIGVDDYRARRLAISEVNRAQNRAQYVAMNQIQRQSGASFEKRCRNRSDNPCEFCRAEAARGWIPADSTYSDVGDEIVGADGGIYKNNFVDMVTCDMHPFCECVDEYRVVNELGE